MQLLTSSLCNTVQKLQLDCEPEGFRVGVSTLGLIYALNHADGVRCIFSPQHIVFRALGAHMASSARALRSLREVSRGRAVKRPHFVRAGCVCLTMLWCRAIDDTSSACMCTTRLICCPLKRWMR